MSSSLILFSLNQIVFGEVERSHWSANFSGPSSSAAARLAAYLEDCVPRIPQTETSFPIVLYTEHPASDVGKVLRCLAECPNVASMAMLFYGFPGANGVFSAALGARARRAWGHSPLHLVTAEGVPRRCQQGHDYLREHNLGSLVSLRCESVCVDDDEHACENQLLQNYCPGRDLDVLAVDLHHGMPTILYRSFLDVCKPKVLLVGNSGLRWWRYRPEVLLEKDNIWVHSGINPEQEMASYMRSPDRWYNFEEQLHHASAHGQGLYQLAVNRQPSRMQADLSWDPDPDRRFSVYIVADGFND